MAAMSDMSGNESADQENYHDPVSDIPARITVAKSLIDIDRWKAGQRLPALATGTATFVPVVILIVMALFSSSGMATRIFMPLVFTIFWLFLWAGSFLSKLPTTANYNLHVICEWPGIWASPNDDNPITTLHYRRVDPGQYCEQLVRASRVIAPMIILFLASFTAVQFSSSGTPLWYKLGMVTLAGCLFAWTFRAKLALTRPGALRRYAKNTRRELADITAADGPRKNTVIFVRESDGGRDRVSPTQVNTDNTVN